MNETIILRIVTPSSFVTNDEVLSITMTSEEGEFTVLPGHAMLMANLKIGIVSFATPSGILKYFTYGGIARVTAEAVNIASEFVVDMQNVEKSEITSKISTLTAKLAEEIKDSRKDEINNLMSKYEMLMQYIS